MFNIKIMSEDGIMLNILCGEINDSKPCLIIVLPFGLKTKVIENKVLEFEKDFNVITWESRTLADHCYEKLKDKLSVSHHVSDLLKVLDYFSIGSFFIVGFCSGAGIAIASAIELSKRVKKMVLICGEYMLNPLVIAKTNFQRDVDVLLPMAAKSLEKANQLSEYLSVIENNQIEKHEFYNDVSFPFLTGVNLYLHGLNYNEYKKIDFIDLAKKVKQPIRLISTYNDQQVDMKNSIYISNFLKNFKDHIALNGDHYEFLRGNELLNSCIKDFLLN